MKDRAAVTVTGIAHLISLVPQMLGFAPTESLVVIGLRNNQVAVMGRMDLSEGIEMFESTWELVTAQTDMAIGVVYTDDSAPSWVDDELTSRFYGVYLVRRGTWSTIDHWKLGPSTVESALPITDQGLPTREGYLSALAIADVTPAATDDAQELAAHRDHAWLEIDAARTNPELLANMAEYFLSIARQSPQDANACAVWFLYAWATWRLGNSIYATAALEAIAAIDPNYSAAGLLQSALDLAIDPIEFPGLAESNLVA